MVYQYKAKSMIKTPAQVAGEMCEQLARSGGLTPKRLVDANRAEDAPLHNEFEWNDSVAAEAYRENQAAHIIRCLVIKTEETEEAPIRAFVKVIEGKRDYTPIQVAIKSPSMMEVLEQSARKDMEAFVNKYRSIKTLAAVIDSMNEALRLNMQEVKEIGEDDTYGTRTRTGFADQSPEGLRAGTQSGFSGYSHRAPSFSSR